MVKFTFKLATGEEIEVFAKDKLEAFSYMKLKGYKNYELIKSW